MKRFIFVLAIGLGGCTKPRFLANTCIGLPDGGNNVIRKVVFVEKENYVIQNFVIEAEKVTLSPTQFTIPIESTDKKFLVAPCPGS